MQGAILQSEGNVKPIKRITALTAVTAVSALAAGSSLAHEIEAVHVHESHIAQGVALAMLAGAAVAVFFVVAYLRRRARR
jgi:hypothetical protein